MEYSKKAFGQKFIDYLGPKNYNLMPVNIKKEIFCTELNTITTGMKKNSKLVIFNTWLNNKEIKFNCIILILDISILFVCFDYSIIYL